MERNSVILPERYRDPKRVIVWGCMFSGKSTELQKIKRRLTFAKKTVLLCNPQINTRDREDIVRSHDGIESAAFTFDSAGKLLMHVYHFPVDAVLIEEAQFIPKLEEICDGLYSQGIDVYISSLNENFEGRPWPHIANFIHTCEVVQLFAVCRDCGSMRASHSAKITTELPDAENVLIGGEDKFKALCTRCFISHLDIHRN